MSMLSSLTGGGGLSGGAGGPSSVGPTAATSGTGNKAINIGGNPNVTSGALTVPLLVAAALAGIYLWRRSK